jgi:hypothetical protein
MRQQRECGQRALCLLLSISISTHGTLIVLMTGYLLLTVQIVVNLHTLGVIIVKIKTSAFA